MFLGALPPLNRPPKKVRADPEPQNHMAKSLLQTPETALSSIL